MDEQSNRVQFNDMSDTTPKDIDEGLKVGFISADTFEERAHEELHRRHHGHTAHHIDLDAAEYTPEDLARLIGTSTDVVLHAARSGELRAQRAGHHITSISHADAVEWLRKRASGV